MRYRKKSVVIEAMKLELKNYTALMAWLEENNVKRTTFVEGVQIETLEGNMMAYVGDYIIKGVKGEFYPCKPDIFEMTYEPEQSQTDNGGCGE